MRFWVALSSESTGDLVIAKRKIAMNYFKYILKNTFIEKRIIDQRLLWM